MASENTLWQRYVDRCLMYRFSRGGFDSAAIVSLDGVIWAKSAEFPELKEGQIDAIMKVLEEPTVGNSIAVGEETYTVAKCGSSSIRAKKDGGGKAGGITIKKTNQALLIGIYSDPVTDANYCNQYLDYVGSYLVRRGY